MAKVKKKAAQSKASPKASPKAKAAAKTVKAGKPTVKARAAKAAAKPVKAVLAKAAKVGKKVKATVKAKIEKVKAAAAAKLEKSPVLKAAKSSKAAKAAPAAAGASIDVGSSAPAFTLKDQSGATVSSSELRGKPYVLYFYPKDDTSGCTAEACGFRDSGPKFGERGVRVIGVSPDSEASHAKFAGKYGLPFTLLADPEKQLIQAYGAWVEKQNYGRKYMGVQRSTFLVGADGTVKKAWRSVKVPGHVDAVLAATQS